MKNTITLLLTISFLFTLKAQDQFFDCSGAIVLCEKTNLVVSQLKGAGNRNYEIGRTSCSDHLKETNSVWLKWETGLPGKIEFTIRPLIPGDDIDFIVYQMDGSIFDCNNKREIRCMASGESIGGTYQKSLPCLDATGLKESSKDFSEKSGCSGEQDNFLAAIDSKRGETYAMVVNNFTSENGFILEFKGNAEFQSPSEIDWGSDVVFQSSNYVFFARGFNDALFEKTENLNKGQLFKNKARGTNHIYAGCSLSNGISNSSDGLGEPNSLEIGEVFPNPTHNSASLYVKSGFSAFGRLEITDIYGRIYLNRSIIIHQDSQVVDIPVKELEAGVYFVQLKIGATSISRKMVKLTK